MKKHRVLYDWVVHEIDRLSDSEEAEAFDAQLPTQAERDRFLRLAEALRPLGVDFVKARASRSHSTRWTELAARVDEFQQFFPNFPSFAYRKFRVHILVANALAQSAAPLDATDVNHKAFELRAIQEALRRPWFVYQNIQSFADSVVALDCGDIERLQKAIPSTPISDNLAFHLLATLKRVEDLPPGHSVLVRMMAPPLNDAPMTAFVQLVALAQGEAVHAPQTYSLPPAVIDRDEIRAGASYHQLNDVFYVLSEYNSREDILSKYLTLYHVVENFMYKAPIVELERQKNGQMFSIRDFQRLYRHVDELEKDAIRKLMRLIGGLDARPATTFKDHIATKWTSLVPGVAQADLDAALEQMGLRFKSRPMKFNEFSGHDLMANLADLAYGVRNAVVHNKETEFHLTYATLNAPMRKLISVFLIPTLEEICFWLVGKPNDYVWYANRELLLYQ